MGANVSGQLVDPSTAELQYSMNANVHGLSTSGSSSLFFSGTLANGTHVSIRAKTVIMDSVSAVMFPMGCSATGPECTSEIPAAFVGESLVTISTEGTRAQAMSVMPVMIESAYDNPFGSPIVITFGTSGQISIVATYTSAHIQWSDVQLGGVVTGTTGKNTVSGVFSMTVNSYENLVSGTEKDHGSIALQLATGQDPVNLKGWMSGTSTIPTTGTSDCSAMMQLPPSTCTITGLQSSGHLELQGSGVWLNGKYSTTWTAPAIGFTSTVSALASSNSQSHAEN